MSRGICKPAQSGRELVFIKKNETSAKIQLAEFPGQAVQEKPAVLTNRKATTQPEGLARETDRAGPSKCSGLWHVVMASTEEIKTRPQRMGRNGWMSVLPALYSHPGNLTPEPGKPDLPKDGLCKWCQLEPRLDLLGKGAGRLWR